MTQWKIRSVYDPEVIVDQTTAGRLSQYEERTIRLIEAHNLDETTRSGVQYREGKLVVDHTRDDKGNPIDAYYVEVSDGLLIPIDLGDGLFLDNLPTDPKRVYPKDIS